MSGWTLTVNILMYSGPRIIMAFGKLCALKGVEVIPVDSRKGLGKTSGIERGVTAVAILK
ncbi:MAG: hypothetical protein NUV68_00025 [Caldiserica bacterium]|jgi:ribosomal protein L7Ae-like RNA K-turn-binding protein|nr:hypothetical protein [Caldisericota bacterium]MDH7561750.1 hypothetical protein [Caldisericota bacterium]